MLSRINSVYPLEENDLIEPIPVEEKFSSKLSIEAKRQIFQEKGIELSPGRTSMIGYIQPCLESINQLKKKYPAYTEGIDYFISNIKYIPFAFFEDELKKSIINFNTFINTQPYTILKPISSHESWVADKSSNYIEYLPKSVFLIEDFDGFILTASKLISQNIIPVFFEDWVFEPIMFKALLEGIGENLKTINIPFQKKFVLISPYLSEEAFNELISLKHEIMERYGLEFHLFYSSLSIKSLHTISQQNKNLFDFFETLQYSQSLLKFTAAVYSEWRSNLTERLPRDLTKIVKDVTPYYQQSPLLNAILSRNEQLVFHLAENKLDLDTTDSNLNTPLHLAVLQNEPTYLTVLLENGAYVHAQDINGKMAIDIAIEYSEFLLCNILFQFGAKAQLTISNTDLLNRVILKCAYNKYIYVLNQLINDSLNLDHIKSPKGDKLISILLAHRDTPSFFKKIILLKNATFIKTLILDTPYDKFMHNNSCIMIIAQHGSPWMLELGLSRYPRSFRLFSNNHKIHYVTDLHGDTILHHAAREKNKEMLSYLQEKYFVNFNLIVNNNDESAFDILEDDNNTLLLESSIKPKPVLFQDQLLDFFNHSKNKFFCFKDNNFTVRPYNSFK